MSRIFPMPQIRIVLITLLNFSYWSKQLWIFMINNETSSAEIQNNLKLLPVWLEHYEVFLNINMYFVYFSCWNWKLWKVFLLSFLKIYLQPILIFIKQNKMMKALLLLFKHLSIFYLPLQLNCNDINSIEVTIK